MHVENVITSVDFRENGGWCVRRRRQAKNGEISPEQTSKPLPHFYDYLKEMNYVWYEVDISPSAPPLLPCWSVHVDNSSSRFLPPSSGVCWCCQVSLSEFKRWLEANGAARGMTETEVETLFKAVDVDNSGAFFWVVSKALKLTVHLIRIILSVRLFTTLFFDCLNLNLRKLNLFANGNPFLGTKSLGIIMERDFGVLKEVKGYFLVRNTFTEKKSRHCPWPPTLIALMRS